MQQALQLLERLGYPRDGLAWVKRQRAWVIVMLAIASWAVVALVIGILAGLLG